MPAIYKPVANFLSNMNLEVAIFLLTSYFVLIGWLWQAIVLQRHDGGLFNPLSTGFIKWSNTLKQFIGNRNETFGQSELRTQSKIFYVILISRNPPEKYYHFWLTWPSLPHILWGYLMRYYVHIFIDTL